jgi:hypothetical protein
LGVLALLVAGSARAAEKPLDKEDVLLLLLGGASTEKMITLIQQRGIEFRMNPDLAKKFHDAGASDEVIEALQRAGAKVAAEPANDSSSTVSRAAPAPPPAANRVQPPVVSEQPAVPASARSSAEPLAEGLASARSTPAAVSTSEPVRPATPAREPALTDPPPDKIDSIIREFAAKEQLFKEARNNYTYRQINKVQELSPDGDVVGTFEQDWDILFDDNGKRIEKVTYAPVPTLQRIGVTAEDLEGMRNIQPFVLTTSELPDYDVKYLGHVKVDEITAYVFSIRPKEIKKGRLYFQGTVWVDDRDLQIVKSEGKQVPEVQSKKGQENLFPRFTTYREQIDGKYWFPTFTMADDTLYFASGPVRVRQIIRYTDYKQFKAKVRIITTAPADEPRTQGPKP